MYQLNSESNIAKFYEWIWNVNVSDYKNMCPYFWKYVLTILFLPIILLGKFLYWIMPAKKSVLKVTDYVAYSKFGDACGSTAEYIFIEKEKWWVILGKILKWIFFISVGALALFSLGALAYKFYQNPLLGFAIIGGLTTVVGVIALIVWLFTEYPIGRALGSPFRLFGTMISSLYHNWCPLIKWD